MRSFFLPFLGAALLLAAGAPRPAAANPPRNFPKAAPQSGDTAGCPSVEVLSRRFNTQNDANGGGYGYYPVSWDANRQPSVVRPSQEAITRLIAGETAGRPLDLDDKLQTMWGTRCAYPDVDYVKTGLDTLRAQYTKETGVSPETEARWHKLMVDTVAFSEGKYAVCGDGKGWPMGDDEAGFFLKATCGGYRNDVIVGYAFRHLDHSDPSPVWRAAVVGVCGEVLKGDGAGTPSGFEYHRWRQCKAELEGIDEAALESYLREKAPNPVAAAAFQVWYEKGRGRIAAYAEPMAKVEQATPAVRQAWEDASTKVNEVWHPALEKWRGELDALDAWEARMAKDPSQPGACDAELTPKLQAYVKATAPGAKGEQLLAVLKDPVGYRFSSALALCHRLLGRKHLTDMWRDVLLSGGVRVEGEHQGMQELLIHNAGYGKYNGQPVPLAPPGGGLVLALVEESWAQKTIGRPTPQDQLSSLKRYSVEKVASIKVEGDQALLTFVRHTGTVDRITGCKTDYSRLLQIDQWGYLHYAETGCRSETVTVDMTQVPSHVPAWQVAHLKVGDTVIIDWRGDPTPPDLDLAWIKRGADVVWAAGVTP